MKNVSKKVSELNTYFFLLFYSERKEEAIAVARLNIMRFPNKYYPHLSLVHKLIQIGNKSEALLKYQKSLKLNPENEIIQGYINDLTSNSSKS